MALLNHVESSFYVFYVCFLSMGYFLLWERAASNCEQLRDPLGLYNYSAAIVKQIWC